MKRILKLFGWSRCSCCGEWRKRGRTCRECEYWRTVRELAARRREAA